jgi:hypothetical protein
MHWHGINAVAQRELAVGLINGDDLAIGISRRSAYSNPDIAGKDVMARPVQHGINIDALALLKRYLRGLRSVTKDVRALIEEHSPASAPEHGHNHAIAHMVHIPNDPAYKRCIAGRKGRWIKNGIATVVANAGGG